jgi:hypothetical protein
MKDIGKHQNIIEYIEYSKGTERVFKDGAKRTVNYLALEFAENKTLLDYLINQTPG